ncbi:MAG: DUF481 domain-containing protein [Mariprofundus sp.]|nr:DUF481 domain-containing protein [Mariprofundus sp.]
MNNADRVSGYLQSMSEGKLTWVSEKMGTLVIDQTAISLIETRNQYQVRVGREPVYTNCLLSILGKQQTILCDDKARSIADWRLITVIAAMPMLERDTAEVMATVLVGLENASGNTATQGYELDGEMQVRYDLTRHHISAEYDIRETDKIKTKNETKIAYGFDWFLTDDWFVNVNGSFQRDEFKNLQERKTGGVGAGYQAIDSNIMDLSMEAGVTHIYEMAEGGGDQEFDSAFTLSAFALGLVLLIITLILNIVSTIVVRKFRQQYE